MRTRIEPVVFDHPFSIEGAGGEYPPGTYAVEIDEELIPSLSFVAYRRVRTTITLPVGFGAGTARQVIPIEAAALEAALLNDKAADRTQIQADATDPGSGA